MKMEEQFVPIDKLEERPTLKKRGSSNSLGSDSGVGLEHKGDQDTLEYRIHAKHEGGKKISLWHDISLVHIDPETGNDTPFYNFICEIPKFTRYVLL